MFPRREAAWTALSEGTWDVLVVGGGITGAGILREAARMGLRAALVEARDYAWGTSSRSSKLVHGGLRYLATGAVGLTLESVREREALRRAAPYLVPSLPFLMPSYRGDRPAPWVMGVGLAAYDALGGAWRHQRLDPAQVRRRCPLVSGTGLVGGFSFQDAQTDDARLVLRVLAEAVADGAVALSYARAVELVRSRLGSVVGAVVQDASGRAGEVEVRARVVINATGAQADVLRGRLGRRREIRPLRGSHLVFPAGRLPVDRAVSLLHPRDQRPVFALPWEGVTLFGTTDLDHGYPLGSEPSISSGEVDYLIDAARMAFPGQDLGYEDVRATFAGVRPVVDSGHPNPSKESREHVLRDEQGLLTLTGGKLTTFRAMGVAALRAARPYLDGVSPEWRAPLAEPTDLSELVEGAGAQAERLVARYGHAARERVEDLRDGDLERIDPDGPALWGELRWAARHEGVVHLDDLLLRRVRLGLVAHQGGIPLLPRIRELVQAELGWEDLRWEEEATAYERLWHRRYHLPEGVVPLSGRRERVRGGLNPAANALRSR